MNPFTRLSIACAAALACASGASAQDLGHKAPPQESPIVITNASIHPVSGPVIERGYVALTAAYALVYIALLLTASVVIFARRDFK